MEPSKLCPCRVGTPKILPRVTQKIEASLWQDVEHQCDWREMDGISVRLAKDAKSNLLMQSCLQYLLLCILLVVSASFPSVSDLPNFLPNVLKSRALPIHVGNGWHVHVNNIGCFAPFNIAAVDLTAFYAGILVEARINALNGVLDRRQLHFTYGTLSLFLDSTANLEWAWVADFVEFMVRELLPPL